MRRLGRRRPPQNRGAAMGDSGHLDSRDHLLPAGIVAWRLTVRALCAHHSLANPTLHGDLRIGGNGQAGHRTAHDAQGRSLDCAGHIQLGDTLMHGHTCEDRRQQWVLAESYHDGGRLAALVVLINVEPAVAIGCRHPEA